MDLKGKVALVTGSSRGVGRATVLALAKGGCSVVINWNQSRAEADQTRADAGALGARAIAVQGSVEKDSDCRALMAAAVAEFGRLDILVNNAGTTRFIPHARLEDVSDADWDRIFAVNVKGAFQCSRAARPHLKSTGGSIVNVASVAGLTGAGSSIPYCASKAALINLTIALARTLAPEIRVNAVAPGFIAGDWLQRGLGADYERVKEAKAAHALLGKVCQPEDVAAAILSLITGSELVTGQLLVCDAGHGLGPRLG